MFMQIIIITESAGEKAAKDVLQGPDNLPRPVWVCMPNKQVRHSEIADSLSFGSNSQNIQVIS